MNGLKLSFLLFVGASSYLAAEEALTSEEIDFFEARIRPALVAHCYKCHSADEKIKGGLQLDTREGLRHGGDSGQVVVPGKPEESLLWTAITWGDEDYEMPPKQKLPASVLADFRKWIEMGAPDPRVGPRMVARSEIDLEEGRKFWSFQPLRPASEPEVKNAEWASAGLDRFVLARLEEHGLSPARAAGPDELLRRIHFDLIGLPPTPQEIEQYRVAWQLDPEAAYRDKVEELLARPQFGERWGRYWLDVARYAESSGRELNMTFPHAWRYRDYVIDSFNADKPYDRFIREQVAGDLLSVESDEEWQHNLIATAFLAVGPKGLNERNPRQFALDLADEQIDVMSQAILGLTVSCARCHDHKSDPIPTSDYYALSGIFQSTRTYFGTINLGVSRRGSKLLELPVPDDEPLAWLSNRERDALSNRVARAEAELVELQRAVRSARQRGQTGNPQQIRRLRTNIVQMRARLNGFGPDGRAKALAMGVQDYDEPVEPVVFIRGELDKPAQEVPRGFLQVLDHPEIPTVLPTGGSGRLELARWLTSEQNPLTARVMVNRVWQQLMGSGLVATPNNFGATGQAPTHPELLDHLALQFIEEGWSVKGLIRELVHSQTYRMGSAFDEVAYGKDPENSLRWRFSPRRLDSEALRDAMLVASGELDLKRPRGSAVARLGDSVVGRRPVPGGTNHFSSVRSVYLPYLRDALPEALALFDPADPNLVTGKRESTNVPGQALYLMNNSFVMEQAQGMARRLMEEAEDPEQRIALAFTIAYGRAASSTELEQARDFLGQFSHAAGQRAEGADRPESLALATFCQGLLISAEFRYLN